jgi:ATPase subunit of ABC transporter with duplicated ATPase domains
MRQWEERGYGQGRKKKKGKDVAKGYEKKLSRLDVQERPWSPWRLELKLISRGRGGDVVARLERAVLERDGFRLGPTDLEIRQGERLAILGPNGVGKSTLLGALLGELPLSSGRRWVGPSVVFGAIDQASERFSGPDPVLTEFTSQSPLSTQETRGLLAKFGLSADHVRRPGSSLSPGERTRATLALLVSRGVNTLILDEPTNRRTIWTSKQLSSSSAHCSRLTEQLCW